MTMTDTGILAALDHRRRGVNIVVDRITKVGEHFDHEALDMALVTLERARRSSSPAFVKTWEHSSITRHGGPLDGQLERPEGIPQQLFACLKALLDDQLIIDGLAACTHRHFLMTPTRQAPGVAVWAAPEDMFVF